MPINNYEQIARDVLKSANTTTDASGRLYIDGTQTGVILSKAIADCIYTGGYFRDGMGCTTKYTVGSKPGDTIRVPLITPFPSSSTTLKIGARPGVASAINTNAPLLPTDDEFLIVLNQVNNQQILFPDFTKDAIPLSTMAQRIAGYSTSVDEDRNASMLAEVIAYNAYRALNNSGANLRAVENLSADNAYGKLLNNLTSALDKGDLLTGAHTYPSLGRVIIGRPEFINGLFNKDSGVVVSGGDIAQNILKYANLDLPIEERNYYGNAYKGFALGFHLQSAPPYSWTLAEQYLGLPEGALDHVYAIACSSEANAMAENFDFGVKIIDANEVRGSKAQPLFCWGHEAFRLSYLIGDSSLTTSYLTSIGFSADERKYPAHPSNFGAKCDKITAPIYDADRNIIGFQEVANVPKPYGGSIQPTECKVTLTTKISTSATDLTALPVVKVGNIEYVVTKKGDSTGIYEFVLPYSQGAVVTCSHTVSGTPDVVYAGTATITNAQASAGAYALTITLEAVD